MSVPQMTVGYCYEYGDKYWASSPDEDWSLEIAGESDIADAKTVGNRVIDGSLCVVWLCRDGLYRAQLTIFDK